MRSKPKTPPKKETIQFRISNETLKVLFSTINVGLKPNLPKNLIKKILPKTPEIVFPTRPKEYFLNVKPIKIAPIIPNKILIKEIRVSVIIIIIIIAVN